MRYQELVTEPSGRAHTHGADDGRVSWRLHIVPVTNTPADRFAVALCGLQPRHGWGVDLFVDTPCQRCDARAQKLYAELMAKEVPHSGYAEHMAVIESLHNIIK